MGHRKHFLASLFALALVIFTFVAAVPAFAEPTRFDIDPAATQLSFFVEATGHDVEGLLFVQSGYLVLDPDNGTAQGEITIDATRGDTGNQKRDKAMVKKVFLGQLYPRIVFHPESFTGDLSGEGAGEIEVQGQVSIAGGEHALTLPVKIERDGGSFTATAAFPVPYVDWGMESPSLLFLRVGKVVEVKISAAGQIAAAQLAQTAAAGTE